MSLANDRIITFIILPQRFKVVDSHAFDDAGVVWKSVQRDNPSG